MFLYAFTLLRIGQLKTGFDCKLVAATYSGIVIIILDLT